MPNRRVLTDGGWDALSRILERLEKTPRENWGTVFGQEDADEAMRETALRLMEQPSVPTAELQGAILRIEDRSADTLLGRRFGPWKLLETLGWGGYGTVYRAQRDDGISEQHVALKVLNEGLKAHATVRFRRERRMLARLEHPNIARLIDGGETEDGRLYLVIELVEGLSLPRYCEANGLSLTDRLELFEAVCNATHAAHQKAIIHRDLKPSNILVTVDGQVKLLDFGIAKLFEEDEAQKQPQLTQHDHQPKTRPYASPEQDRNEDVSTASDIFSLGVMLHELLVGQWPSEGPIPLDLEDPSLWPSRAVLANTALPVPARKACSRQIRGDLDAIVIHCRRELPNNRYADVRQLIEDLCAFRANLPIAAVKSTLAYRTRKHFRRNWAWVLLGSIAAGAIGIALVAGARAELMRRISETRRLAAESLNLQETERDLAFLLALEAYHDRNPPEGLRSLATILTRSPYLNRLHHQHEDYVRELAFDHQGRLFSRSIDGEMVLTDRESSQPALIRWLPREPERKDSLPIALSPDDRFLAFAEQGCVAVTDLLSNASVTIDSRCADASSHGLIDRGELRRILFAPTRADLGSQGRLLTASFLIAAWQQGPIARWRTDDWSRQLIDFSLPSLDASIITLATNRSGDLLAIATARDMAACESFLTLESRKLTPRPGSQRCSCIEIVHTTTGRLIHGPICLPDNLVWSLDFHPTKDEMASAWLDGAVRVWPFQSAGLPVFRKIGQHLGGVTKLQFMPDGQYLASTAWDGNIKIWDLAKNEALVDLRGHGGGTLSVAVSPGGKQLASGGQDGKIATWDLSFLLNSTKSFLAHDSGICCLVFSPSGNRLYSASRDAKVRVWQTAGLSSTRGSAWTLSAEIDDARTPLTALALSRSGRLLAAGGIDGVTRFWDARSLTPRPELVIPRDPKARVSARIRTIAFDPTAETVVVSAEPDTIHVRHLSPPSPPTIVRGRPGLSRPA